MFSKALLASITYGLVSSAGVVHRLTLELRTMDRIVDILEELREMMSPMLVGSVMHDHADSDEESEERSCCRDCKDTDKLIAAGFALDLAREIKDKIAQSTTPWTFVSDFKLFAPSVGSEFLHALVLRVADAAEYAQKFGEEEPELIKSIFYLFDVAVANRIGERNRKYDLDMVTGSFNPPYDFALLRTRVGRLLAAKVGSIIRYNDFLNSEGFDRLSRTLRGVVSDSKQKSSAEFETNFRNWFAARNETLSVQENMEFSNILRKFRAGIFEEIQPGQYFTEINSFWLSFQNLESCLEKKIPANCREFQHALASLTERLSRSVHVLAVNNGLALLAKDLFYYSFGRDWSAIEGDLETLWYLPIPEAIAHFRYFCHEDPVCSKQMKNEFSRIRRKFWNSNYENTKLPIEDFKDFYALYEGASEIESGEEVVEAIIVNEVISPSV